MTDYVFEQVDVFTSGPLLGNPLAVVLGADGLSDGEMARFANWTNLSETTFLLRPTMAEADYRVRIFTPERELPFAGHPTLGSAHVWLRHGGKPRRDTIIQQCEAGPIPIRHDAGRLAFAAPPLLRSGPVDEATLERIAHGLRIEPGTIRAANWIDNGPGWVGVRLDSRAAVLAIEPDFAAIGSLDIGVIGPWDPATDGDAAQFEVRALYSREDPVTGSLNAGLAQWLIGAGLAPARYVVRQGTRLGRAGAVHVERDGAAIWIGGAVETRITGTLLL